MNLKVLKSLRRRIRRVIGASFQVAMSQSDSAASASASASAAAAAEVPATTPKAPAAPPKDLFDSILFAFRPSEEYGGGVLAYGQQLFNYLKDRGNGTQDLNLVPVEVLHHYKDTTRVEHEFFMVGFKVDLDRNKAEVLSPVAPILEIIEKLLARVVDIFALMSTVSVFCRLLFAIRYASELHHDATFARV
ncbi:hypothetical protein BXZ70DRAFT_910079 [Cristinia sonorae]|uniref:Uncharacterized protein n=1 Tax=Cristinia sonorae TaxID=1940300 RepID=A0A8K0UHI8_9AGAR|nr:hypothetical protein BXZ70DRAFT_910079 [Cristinia sonorae]